MDNPQRKTNPAIEPVTLAEMRRTMGSNDPTDTARDEEIIERIATARSYCEIFTGRSFINSSWEFYADRFEACFPLKTRLQSVESLTYIDADGVQQTLASDQYYVDTKDGILYPAWGVTWPAARPLPNSIVIEHTAGYGANASDVPSHVKLAIKFLVQHWEEYQPQIAGTRISTVPYAVEQLLRPERDCRRLVP
jgi:uncharacterized phiE125 gp8 family phage protein